MSKHEFEKILEETLEASHQNPPKNGLVDLLRIFSYFNKPQKKPQKPSHQQESNLHHRNR